MITPPTTTGMHWGSKVSLYDWPPIYFQLAVLLHVSNEPPDRAGVKPKGALCRQKVVGEFLIFLNLILGSSIFEH